MTFARSWRFISQHPLTRKQRLRALSRYLAWQFTSRLTDEIEFDWIDGVRVIARRGMTGFTGNIYCGLHEFADMGFLLHILHPGDTFLDVGANVGSYTLLASGVCGARTIAFEPDPNAAQFLRRNIKLNHLQPLVTLHEMALGDTEGQTNFTIGRDTTNQVALEAGEDTRRLPIGRLDNIEGARGAVFIKLDVEGYEDHVVAGAETVLGDPALLAVESEGLQDEVVDTLNRHGFARAYYDPFSRRLGDSPIGEAASNGLFVRDWPAVRDRIAVAPKRRVLEALI